MNAVSARGLVKRYRDVDAVSEISFEGHPGAAIGPAVWMLVVTLVFLPIPSILLRRRLR